jgi:aryl-alcohol dehydrogenase-like predicted oxidoreductase
MLNGLWQVSGAHGRIDCRRAIDEMFAYHDAGFTTWDLADHYGPAEDFIGEFRREFAERRGPARLAEIQAFTKWVPRSGPMTRQVIDDAISVSLWRMGVGALDLLQFHWWDYSDHRSRRAQTPRRPSARRQDSPSRSHQLRHRASGHHP